MDITPKQLLGPPITASYAPQGFYSLFFYTRARPVFSQVIVRDMLTDPRILFGLWLIKGPIQDKATFSVECDDQEVTDFVQRQIDRFWRNSAHIALKALEWGFSGSEVLYRERTHTPKPSPGFNPSPSNGKGQSPNGSPSLSNPQNHLRMASPPFPPTPQENGEIASGAKPDPFLGISFLPSRKLIEFDRLKDIHAIDLKAVTLNGKIAGMYVNRAIDENSRFNKYVYIGGPKKFWHVHWEEKNPWYGLSRLFGCYIPWWEKWSDGGFRDIRRLWFHKNAFEGGTLYYPFGGSTRDDLGNIVSYKDIARDVLEKKRSGGMLFLPNTVQDERGTRQWEYIPASANPVPAGLLDYGQLLDKEILEGLGVPTEIIESSGEQGFGAASGRQVPETAFYAILQALINPLVDDFKNQICDDLVKLNFGEDVEYDIIANPLTASTDPASNPSPFGDPNIQDPNGFNQEPPTPPSPGGKKKPTKAKA